ncbi:MAG: hypothetical protein WCX96_02980, partial [Bacilli bacterium]
LKLIGKDYFLSNREALPKEIGEASSVSIKTLIKEGYTKEVKDYNKEICDSNASYVEAIKLEKGKYNYHTYLECKNYTTGDIWSEWSSWSDEEPIGGKDMEIETATFYNYEEALDYWSDWSDWEEVSDNGKIVPINEIIDTESQYRYRDQQWKWNNGGGREYASGYYVSAPAGYPFQDSNQTSWEETWHNGSATGSSTRQVQYKNKVEYPTSSYYTYDNIPTGYPNRYSFDGTVSGWTYKYYSEGNNGYSYTYDSKRTGALSTRTRSRTWGDWITISSGSVTPSTTRQVQFRDKKYRYSRYRYFCSYFSVSTFKTVQFYKYNSKYYSSPSLSTCKTLCPIPSGITRDYGCNYVSMSSKYGDYDRNENNVTGDTISTSYGRKSWTIDGPGQWYAWQSYSSTLSYDPNKKEVQYRDLNKYTAYSGWVAQSSGTHVVNDLKDIMYKNKLYKYYKLDWGPWSATQTSGTYTISDTRTVQYRDKTYKYYKDTLETCGDPNQYYSESPDPLCGYKDETNTIHTDWVIGSNLPESKDYRTIQRQIKTRIRDWTGPLLPSYVPEEEFEKLTGKTLQEVDALDTARYVPKTMYRYRKKIY